MTQLLPAARLSPWGVDLPLLAQGFSDADYRELLLRAVHDLRQRAPVSLVTYPLLFGLLSLHPAIRAEPGFWVGALLTLLLTLPRYTVSRTLDSEQPTEALAAQGGFMAMTVLQGAIWGCVVALIWWRYSFQAPGVMMVLTTTGIAGGSLGTFTYSMRSNTLYQTVLAFPLLLVVVLQTLAGDPDVWVIGGLVVSFLGFLLVQGRHLEREYWEAELGRIRVERKHAELVAAREKAEAAAKAKGVFLATMSHELRTPLNGVLGMVDLLRSGTVSREQDQYLRNIASAGDSLLELIDDVLDTVRLERGRVPVLHRPFRPSELLDEVLACLASQAWKGGLELSGHIDERVPASLCGDAARLRHVLLNLVGNAIKFTERGHVAIRISARPLSQERVRLRLEVEDTGRGLAGVDIERLFRPFEQGEGEANRLHGGTGLGLSICKGLVTELGGQVAAEDRPGPGALFWAEVVVDVLAQQVPRPVLPWTKVYVEDAHAPNHRALSSALRSFGLQVVEESQAQACFLRYPVSPQRVAGLRCPVVLLASGPQLSGARRMAREHQLQVLLRPLRRSELQDLLQGTPAPTRLPNYAIRSLRVLLVEDNPINLLVARRFLEREGLVCEVAHDGVEALAAMKEKAWDLVLMDCQMPRMDGFEATRQIRAWEQDRDMHPIAIVALTANVFAEDRARCVEAGMDDFLSKPLRRDALCEVLASLAAQGVLQERA